MVNFLGAGFSANYVNADVDIDIPGFVSVSTSEDNYILSAQFLRGLNFDITDTFFLGFKENILEPTMLNLRKL